MEDDLKKKVKKEDDLKKMEDDLKKMKMEDKLIFFCKTRMTTSKKMEDDLKIKKKEDNLKKMKWKTT